MHINSPGGTVAGSEELYDSLIKLKAKKPMVVVVDGLAASGGYIAALASDHIVAQQSAIVGSIGVIFQYPNVTELLKTDRRQGREHQVLAAQGRAQRLRADQPRGARRRRGDRQGLLRLVQGLVRDRRQPRCRSCCSKVADGRVFTGRQAVELKLIDALGDEQAAIAWLAKEKNIDPKTPVRDYPLSPRFGDLPFLHVAAARHCSTLSASTGWPSGSRSGARIQAVERLNLDGLLALWHPPSSN